MSKNQQVARLTLVFEIPDCHCPLGHYYYREPDSILCIGDTASDKSAAQLIAPNYPNQAGLSYQTLVYKNTVTYG